jgi:hypothetical protein
MIQGWPKASPSGAILGCSRVQPLRDSGQKLLSDRAHAFACKTRTGERQLRRAKRAFDLDRCRKYSLGENEDTFGRQSGRFPLRS